MKQRVGVFALVVLCCSVTSRSQAPTAVVNGQVRDSSGGGIAGAAVEVINDATAIRYTTETNAEGIYSVPDLQPGVYHIRVSKLGFKTVVHPDIVLNVQDARALAFTLPVGSVSETVTVEGGAPLINTESAAVSTVVDRQFAENVPMNGRSFQTLIQLTPGVVLTTSSIYDAGQFSVNGQRAVSNYWLVDGVSANIGVGASSGPSNGFSGSLGSFGAQGGTNSLVSVDALQEFRIQTSTYAPEFGRVPGGQISIVTRSGSNQFHGTASDYLRNDLLDANDWFADNKGLPKPQERQNDFGGTLGGPILKERTFFFFSYEGLRLRLPRVAVDTVPDLNARNNASSSIRPFLNAFPLPNGPEVLDSSNNPTGAAERNSTFSDQSTLDAYSIRVDQQLSNRARLFGRYNYSPSQIVQRGLGGVAMLSELDPSDITTQTATIGTTWAISPSMANDLRFNYSKVDSNSNSVLDSFGGAIPLTALPFPSGFTARNGHLQYQIFSLSGGGMSVGRLTRDVQRQINVVDSFSLQRSSHGLKFGIDFRRLSPKFDPSAYSEEADFLDVPSATSGNTIFGSASNSRGATFLFRNLGLFAQDTWRTTPRLTLTYGLRWDVDFAPSTIDGPNLPAATGFNLKNLSQLALAPIGAPPFNTPYASIAPRVGVAYQISQDQRWQMVLRGGFGIFYDLATSEVGNVLFTGLYPYRADNFGLTGAFPFDPAAAAPPPITPPGPTSGTLTAFDPHMELPRTREWNVALEQALGTSQSISLSYVGAAGRGLIQTAFLTSPNPNYGGAYLISNSATSDYDALQVQFQRRLSHGLQALSSYAWSHSIDNGSAGSYGNASNTLVPSFNPNQNRGPASFDIRHTASAAITYEVPAPRINAFTNALLRTWSIESVIQARSAPPVEVIDGKFFSTIFNTFATVRPDRVPGAPLYVYGPECVVVLGSPCPGGKGFNRGAFTDPPTDPNTGAPLRQGNLGRNALRGFGAFQWDFAVHRDFPLHESVKLQFRAEVFNLLNHPNFGQPFGDLRSRSRFGRSTKTLASSLDSFNQGGGSFSPLYQIGGPRSIQIALKLFF